MTVSASSRCIFSSRVCICWIIFMLTPMARLLPAEADGQDSITPDRRLRSIATTVRLSLPQGLSPAAHLDGSGAIQHVSRALQGALGYGHAIEHRGQLSLPRIFIEGFDGRYDAPI